MIKDQLGEFTTARLMGNNPLQGNIPRSLWRIFELGKRVKIYPMNDDINHIVKKVIAIGNGKQRIITIPFADSDLFNKRDKIRLYPI